MTHAAPHFWVQPLRYLRWSARERPAYFYSCVIAAAGPVMLFTVPPLRRRFGDPDAPVIPMTYPGMFSPGIAGRKKLFG